MLYIFYSFHDCSETECWPFHKTKVQLELKYLHVDEDKVDDGVFAKKFTLLIIKPFAVKTIHLS